MNCTYVDAVPVLFGSGNDERLKGWLAPLGDRVRYGTWDGPYPLAGADRKRSLAVLESVVEPLIPAWVRG